jgi:hypothetical protein
MTAISTISELLSLSGSQYRIYDMGRKIDKISKTEFQKIESNQLPYPYPIQGHACIALAFWQKQSVQRYLWFIKIPLDERALINQAARDHFIAIIIEALGADLTAKPTQQQEDRLKDNPYHFTPSQYKLAALNSIINYESKQKPSDYFQHCQEYLSGKLGWHNWQEVGVQGISDFVCRLDQKPLATMLNNALPHLPEQVLVSICSALENQSLSADIIQTLISLLNNTNSQDLAQNQVPLVRSLAASCQQQNVKQLLDLDIFKHHISTEVLIALASRCWLILASKENMMIYLEMLIKQQDQALFNGVFRDLVAIPAIRPILFGCMREPNRSDALAKAIGALFNQGN